MTGPSDFIKRILARLRADHPDKCVSSYWDGSEVRIDVTGSDGSGVTLKRPWGSLHRADQQVWFEQRLRELIAKVTP